MLILIPRAVRPSAAYWPGRRGLAAVDAIAWPLIWLAAITFAPFDAGIVGSFVTGISIVSALLRLHRAMWRNERYWFTTWLWGRPVVVLAVVAVAMKTAAATAGG